MKILELKTQLEVARVQFVGLTYRAKGTGELTRFTLLVGASYDSIVRDSITELEIQRPALSGLDLTACDELLASFHATLDAHAKGQENPAYTKAGQYVSIGNGLRLNLNDSTLEIAGLVQSKVVLERGEYKEVKSRPLTIAKDSLRRQTKVGKYRTFALDAEQVTVKIQGNTLEIA